MPIERININQKYAGYRVHNVKTVYRYIKGDPISRTQALNKAKRQWRAIEARRFS